MNAMTKVTAENPRAVIGSNQPPAPTPYEAAKARIDDLYAEAALWLDGAAVTDQATADGISNLTNMLRAAKKEADAARTADKKPHMDAAKAVDDLYRPVITKADQAADACKAALTPWLAKLEADRQVEAKRLREEAEAKELAAREALRSADAANLQDRAAAEALVKDAKIAGRVANRAGNETATAGGGVGRAIGLRTTYRAEITDYKAFARHAWVIALTELKVFLDGLAQRLVDGKHRDIPGVTIHEEKKAA